MTAKEGWRGRFFEDFEVGDVYEHPLGRTVTTTGLGRGEVAGAGLRGGHYLL
jgi:hypothetical protein